MKSLYAIIIFVLYSYASWGQWMNNGEAEYQLHNGGEYREKELNENQTLVVFTVNGEYISDFTDYAFYVVGYWKEKTGGTPVKPKYSLYSESFGSIAVGDINEGEGKATEVDASFYEDWDMGSTLLSYFDVSMLGKSNLTVNYSDFYCGTSLESLDIVILNKKTGYCVVEKNVPANTQQINVNLVDPTLAPSPSGPTLAVNPIIAGCWAQGGTFDLTQALVSKSPESATVEYYTDANGITKIADPTKAPMPASNLSVSTEVKKYYARAIDGVTFYQKPDVALALSDRKTTVCYNVPIVLQTENKNGFTPGRYHYVSREAALDVDVTTASYATTSKASTTYYVYVTSGNTVGNCRQYSDYS